MRQTHSGRGRVLGAALAVLSAGAATVGVDSAYAQSANQQVASLNGVETSNGLKSINGATPDISALRYYAVRGEQDRVQSEIARLKELYPTWQQPKNIFSDGEDREKPLWDLFSKGNVGKLKAEIKNLQKQIVGYVPSDALMTKIEQRETRGTVASAFKHKRWDDVIEKVNQNPAMLASGDIELIWFVAEAYAQKERPLDSFEAYTAALKTAKFLPERKATMQKAAGNLPTDLALKLLSSVEELQKDPGFADEAADAVVRGALARNAELGEQPSAALRPYIESFEVRTRMGKSHEDAILLAWSTFGQRDWKTSAEWFERALSIKTTPKAVEGSIMAAMRLGDMTTAAERAGEWLNESPEIGALFISVHAPELLKEKPRAMSTEFLQTYASKSGELKNGEGAEALGWYAFNVNQLGAAQAWFAHAVDWDETETAAFGLALTASRMKDRSAFDYLRSTYGPKYPRVAALKYTKESRKSKPVVVKRKSTRTSKIGKLRAQIGRLNQTKQYQRCLQTIRKVRQYGPLRAQDHQMRGWCLMGAKRNNEAELAFATAAKLGGKSKRASAYGQALAALRSGKTNEALRVANANALTKQQRKTIDVELLTQRARAAFTNRDYGASIYALDQRKRLSGETRDLTLMRGWSLYHSGRVRQAGDVFAMLDQQLSTRGSKRGLNAVRRDLNRSVSSD